MFDQPVVRRSFSRRRFFRGLGAGSLLAYPLLRAHRAGAAAEPKVVIFWVGGGLHTQTWKQELPHKTPLASATLINGPDVFEQPQWKSLKPHLTMAYGLPLKWGTLNGKAVGVHTVDAAMSLIGMNATKVSSSNRPLSMDRFLADKWSGTLFASVRLKILGGSYDHSVPSGGGSAGLSKSFNSLGSAYDGLFVGAAGDSKAMLFRRDVLGRSMDECKAVVAEVERQLGAVASRRVQNHCDSLREMEKRIDAQITGQGLPGGAICKPARPSPAGPLKLPFLEHTAGSANATKAQLDAAPDLAGPLDLFGRLTANTLACGRTRVVLYELWSDQPSNSAYFIDRKYGEVGVHGSIFHDDGTSEWQNPYARWLMSRFASLGKALQDLSLLDDTIVIWATNESPGTHTYRLPAPVLYLGHGGGRFATGKYLTYSDAQGLGVNDFYTSVMRGVGLPMDRFGDDNSSRARYGLDDDMLV